MRFLSFVSHVLNVGFIVAFSVSQRQNIMKRFTEHTATAIGCIHMESFAGEYYYTSSGSEDVCGLYLIGLPEQRIQVEFLDFDIDCSKGGLLATVDGWETQGQFFPSDEDHSLPMDLRYKTYCGVKSPKRIFSAHQNAALIQFRVPRAGEGFRIKVSFPDNPEPCNVISLMDSGEYTMKNYGHRRNCSLSVMYPVNVQFVNVDVGQTTAFPGHLQETGTKIHCKRDGAKDYVELLDGSGLDTYFMAKVIDICGLDSYPSPLAYPMPCSHSVVRMVSSGEYFNSLTFSFSQMTEEELNSMEAPLCF